ncbi:MAG: cyclic nucleotide-binding domain-containing protein [Hyphomicrobiales bacterium]
MGNNNVNFLEDRVDFLTQVEIFSDIPANALEHIASVMQERKFNRQEPIVKKGEKGDSMYIVTRGEVRVHDRGHVLCRMTEGEVFGEYTLFDDEKRSASVTAEKVTYTFELSRINFDAVCDRYPEITKGIVLRLIKKMRERNVLEEKLSKNYIKIQKNKKEIESQHQSIQDYKQQLEQQNFDLLALNDEKNKLIGIVVHGLKNPLTSGKCITEMLLEDDSLNEHHKESLEVVNNAMKRMNQMINQILNINTIESKVYTPKIEKVMLKDIVGQVLCHFKSSISEKNINIELDLEDITAKLNKVYFIQIVDNLLCNAIDATPEESSIKLKLFQEDNKVFIELIDGGEQLKLNELEQLFKKYKRQKQTLSAFVENEGLGLSIVKKYVDSMNGNISVIPMDTGNKFSVSFPVE